MSSALRVMFVLLVGSQWFILALLMYLAPTVARWWSLVAIFSLSALPLAGVGMLIARRWRGAATILLALGLFAVCNPIVIKGNLWLWISAQGFRLHVGSIDRYLESCELTDFTEAGIEHAVGTCESYSDGLLYLRIFYDSSDEIDAPLSRRTREWDDAMYYYPPKAITRDSEGRASHIYGHFYSIALTLEELDGDSVTPPPRTKRNNPK